MAANTTASKKAKGRTLQKLICAALLDVGVKFGLEAGDIRSCSMGANGVDVILSPAARRIFGLLAIECKNVEALNVVSTFWEHAEKYPASISLLFHKRSHTDPLCTLRLSDFVNMLARGINANQT